MTVTGTVASILFRNDENGYTVFVVDNAGVLLTVVGTAPPLFEGAPVACEGGMVNNARYGAQLAAKSIQIERPTTTESITRFLSSGVIKGVGAVTAARMVAQFGDRVFEIIEHAPEELVKVKGISSEKAFAIAESYNGVRTMQKTLMFLQSLDITPGIAGKLYAKYGAGAEAVIKNNPYRLIDDVDGIGFRRADGIAKKLGIAEDSDFRLKAGVCYALATAADREGHTCVPEAWLPRMSAEVLDVDEACLAEVIPRYVVDGLLRYYTVDDTRYIARTQYFNTEKRIAAKLISLRDEASPLSGQDIDKSIAAFEDKHKIDLHPEQRAAVRSALCDGVLVITGGPGTGKTTLIRCIIELLKESEQRPLLCAPTGRAAKRMSEATGEEAMTIHRALGFGAQGRSEFVYTDTNPLDAAFVICDEVSMVDVYLMWNLLRALRGGTRLVLVGDKDQLPSVSAGNCLADILRSKVLPVTYLSRIYRQDEGLLTSNAHRINNGDMPKFSNAPTSDFFFRPVESQTAGAAAIAELAAVRLPAFLRTDARRIQVLSPVKNGVAGIISLNKELQARLNPPADGKREHRTESVLFREGDKVMQTSNNYDLKFTRPGFGGTVDEGMGIFNGDIGAVERIIPGAEVTVRFEDGRLAAYPPDMIDQLSLAYAVTVHKSQGCEFDAVVVSICNDNYRIMTRNLLYTAVTRAKRLVVLVGSEEQLRRIVKTKDTAVRYTLLCDLLQTEEGNSRRLRL
ncbi:MAG: ATP-dependent RecD-like DNA helicase [Clostridiales bacterium]|jgi:exodeoxyribonuclease V alpha subunit|nr:ATP-dependent RecD-like DNA helicase [Clostridiales bacterium]